MRLAFWHRPEPEPVIEWHWPVNRQVAYDMADEMAGWPEPIDVIRQACGLPMRWRLACRYGWYRLLVAIHWRCRRGCSRSHLEAWYAAQHGRSPHPRPSLYQK